MCEDAVYHIQCSLNFQTGKSNPKKSIMARKCERDTIVGKERVFLKIVERVLSVSRFSLRSIVWYYNSGKNDGKKIEW